MKYLILVLLMLIPAVAQDLPVSTIQEKSILSDARLGELYD